MIGRQECLPHAVDMNADLDSTVPIRSGEELPLERLQAYLQEHLADAGGPLTVEQFPHGHSNLTYLLRLGDRELVLRRPPFGNQVKTAHDMGREYRVLSRLSDVYAAAPRAYLYCDDESILGAPFYVMERRQGRILRKASPPDANIDAITARGLSTALIDHLALLHSLDYQAAGLGDLGKPQGYVERQVTGWTDRYAKARTDDLLADKNVCPTVLDEIGAGCVTTCRRSPARRSSTTITNTTILCSTLATRHASWRCWTGRWPRWATH